MRATITLIEKEFDEYWRQAARENLRLKTPMKSMSNSLCRVKAKGSLSTAKRAVIGGMMRTTFQKFRPEGEPARVVKMMNLLCDLHGES